MNLRLMLTIFIFYFSDKLLGSSAAREAARRPFVAVRYGPEIGERAVEPTVSVQVQRDPVRPAGADIPIVTITTNSVRVTLPFLRRRSPSTRSKSTLPAASYRFSKRDRRNNC